jgi:hypothetical protein
VSEIENAIGVTGGDKMSKLVGNAVFGQSGGPTAVINASAAGVFTEALKQDCIPKIYGAAHGIKGILEENLYDISCEDEKELELLKTTPPSAAPSLRLSYRLRVLSALMV